jgi:glycosyltransferase involved in cell wall biosynthesis
MKHHLAFFLPDLGGGGAEKIMVTLANEFNRRGYEVDFILVRAGGVNLKHVAKNVRIVDLKARNAITSLPKVIGYLKRDHPDVFLSSLDLTNLISLIAKRIARIDVKLMIRIENTVSSQKRSLLKKKLEKILLSLIYPWAERIIAVSNYVAEDIKRYAGISASKLCVIYNPVVTRELLEKAKEKVNHPWFQAGSLPVILGVGRFTEQKNFPNLVKAFAEVRKERNARLVILGDGELRGKLEVLSRRLGIAEDVDFPGYIENPYSYMRLAKVFVLSSDWEGLPTVLIEALACGCSVISTDCPGGSREILSGGIYGDLVPIDDPKSLAESINRVLSGRMHKIDKMWLEQFSLEHVFIQTMQLIDELSVGKG